MGQSVSGVTMKVRVSFLLLCLSYGIALAAQEAKPRIAIKTFENPVAYQNSTIGNALTEILTTELGKTGKYRIVERDAVAELMMKSVSEAPRGAKTRCLPKKPDSRSQTSSCWEKSPTSGSRKRVFASKL
jgi:hypothetical protein